MPTNPQNTTDITYGDEYSNGTWKVGSHDVAITTKQFPLTEHGLPSADDMWLLFHEMVLRGTSDIWMGDELPMNVIYQGEGGDGTVSRTYDENYPVELDSVAWTAGGDPACAFHPSLTSPAAGAGVDAATVGLDNVVRPQGVNLLEVSETTDPSVADGGWGPGDGKMSPGGLHGGSVIQLTQGGTARSPTYRLGKWSTE